MEVSHLDYERGQDCLQGLLCPSQLDGKDVPPLRCIPARNMPA